MIASDKPLRLCHVAAALVLLALAAAGPSAQDENNVVNQRISVSQKKDTLNIGNQETNNYHIEEKNYQPTQNTHVTVNLGKTKGQDWTKMRRFRWPTVEEMALKNRIMDMYEHAKEEVKSAVDEYDEKSFLHLKHLGSILTALNPKYIATKRVYSVAFADPAKPNVEVVAPERDLDSTLGQEMDASAFQRLELGAGADQPSMIKQLDKLADKLRETVNWEKSFAQKLFEIPDSEVSPSQLAFKKLIQCLTYPLFCNKMLGKGPKNIEPDQDEEAKTSAVEQAPLRERLVQQPKSKRGPARKNMPPPAVPSQEGPPRQHPVGKPAPNSAQLPPRQEEEEEEEEEEEVPEELQYQPPPVRAPPLSRRRFPPQSRAPVATHPWAQLYSAPQYQQEAMPPHGFQPNARMQPQAQPPLRRAPPPRQANDEFAQRLIQKFAPNYEGGDRIYDFEPRRHIG